MNRYRQADVVCITIYLKLLIIYREANWQSSKGSNVGLVPWGHDTPSSNAGDLPLLLLPHFVVTPLHMQGKLSNLCDNNPTTWPD